MNNHHFPRIFFEEIDLGPPDKSRQEQRRQAASRPGCYSGLASGKRWHFAVENHDLLIGRYQLFLWQFSVANCKRLPVDLPFIGEYDNPCTGNSYEPTNQPVFVFFGGKEFSNAAHLCRKKYPIRKHLAKSRAFHKNDVHMMALFFHSYASLLDDRLNVKPKNYYLWKRFIE